MTARRSLRLVALACAAGLAGVACGTTSGGDDAQAPAATIDAAEPAPDNPIASAPADNTTDIGNSTDADADAGSVVPELLQFDAPLIGGGEIEGDTLAGKPTAFWFWSPT